MTVWQEQWSPDRGGNQAGQHRWVPQATALAPGYDGSMSERIVIHLPPMPQPKDFGLDGRSESGAAAKRYEKALEVWERVVRNISRRIGKKK